MLGVTMTQCVVLAVMCLNVYWSMNTIETVRIVEETVFSAESAMSAQGQREQSLHERLGQFRTDLEATVVYSEHIEDLLQNPPARINAHLYEINDG